MDVTLEFSLIDGAGVTLHKQELWFDSLEGGETMKQKLEPIGSYHTIKLRRMIAGSESKVLDYSLVIPKPGLTVPLVICGLVLLIAILLLRPHYEP